MARTLGNPITPIAPKLDIPAPTTTLKTDKPDKPDTYDLLSGLADKYNLGWSWDKDDGDEEEMIKSFMSHADKAGRRDLMDAVKFGLDF